jgi:hypothetical protein
MMFYTGCSLCIIERRWEGHMDFEVTAKCARLSVCEHAVRRRKRRALEGEILERSALIQNTPGPSLSLSSRPLGSVNHSDETDILHNVVQPE